MSIAPAVNIQNTSVVPSSTLSPVSSYPETTQIREGTSYAAWCCGGIGSGLRFTVSKIAQNQTPILVSGVALIALGSMTGVLPQHYASTIFKQAVFSCSFQGFGYGMTKVLNLFSAKIKNDVATELDEKLIKPMSECQVYKMPPLVTCLFAPIEEELLYRGALYGLTRRMFSFTGMQSASASSTAVVASSIIFAAMHMPRAQGVFAKTITAIGPFINAYFMLFPAYLSGGFSNVILAHVTHNLLGFPSQERCARQLQALQEPRQETSTLIATTKSEEVPQNTPT